MTQWLRALAPLEEVLGSVPSTPMVLTTFLHSSSKASDVLFWPIQVPDIHGA